MRFAYVLAAGHVVLASTLVAQQPNKTAPWLFAAGPTWFSEHVGLNVRAEYHVLRDSWLGLRFEAGGRWSPSHSFYASYVPDFFVQGFVQYADVNLGIAATVTPVPRGRIAPYVVLGGAAVQTWINSQVYYNDPQDGPTYASGSGTSGHLVPFWGVGTRVRLSSRIIQLEARSAGNRRDVTIGASLRF